MKGMEFKIKSNHILWAVLILAALGLWLPLVFFVILLCDAPFNGMAGLAIANFAFWVLVMFAFATLLLSIYAVLAKPWRKSGFENIFFNLQIIPIILACFGAMGLFCMIR
ncbi:hypothetical protein ACQR5V_01660 [Xanthomonas oryzae pv. oryzicola]|uniref:hypothetical protein n=1 Tax=Xanthomonas oryzae TaxID=347 RepID=UPI0005CE13EF|nr:hypothetical protein [Xanthomonas oryzae]AJQ88607.1 hypothetical protein BE73_17300 [Xanthomonas oryzae pv. oryzicola]OWB32159.1 hypothetical protein XocBAI21_06235 [Xanthomonas oryzae pv. oryzicola]QBG99091.1 hypothetical protein EYC56_06405 [Xanthomonas oryzae]